MGSSLVIGFPLVGNQVDMRKLNQPIHGAILTAQKIAIYLQANVATGLIEGVLDWIPED
jgi:hypothetical protein